MTFELSAAFSLSVGIAAIISWVRLKKTDSAYLPFFIWLWIGFLSEVISILLMIRGYSNTALYNFFSLFEAIIITWQFKRWRLFGNNNLIYYCCQLLYILSFCAEIIARGNAYEFVSFFIVEYSTIIVFIAIGVINSVIFKDPMPLFLNPLFLICMGWIIYFTYMALIEIFWVYGLNKSSTFRIRVYDIFAFINLFTNLLFAFATLWIPMKRRYILQS